MPGQYIVESATPLAQLEQVAFMTPKQVAMQTGTFKATLATPAWYKKWWVWALIGGGVVVAGTGGYLLYRRKRG